VDNVEDFARKTMMLPVADEKSGIRIDFVFSFYHSGRPAYWGRHRITDAGIILNLRAL